MGLHSIENQELADRVADLVDADSIVYDMSEIPHDNVFFTRNGKYFHLRIHKDNAPLDRDKVIALVDDREQGQAYDAQDHLILHEKDASAIALRGTQNTDGASAESVHLLLTTAYGPNGEEHTNMARKVNRSFEVNALESLRLQYLGKNPVEDVTVPKVYHTSDDTLWTEFIAGPTAGDEMRAFPETRRANLLRLARAAQGIQEAYNRQAESSMVRAVLPTANVDAVRSMGPASRELVTYLEEKNRFNTYIPDCRPDNFFLKDTCVKIDEGGKMVGSEDCFIGKMCDFDDTVSEEDRDWLMDQINPPNMTDALLSLYVSTIQSAQPKKGHALYKRIQRAKGYLERVMQRTDEWDHLASEFANVEANATQDFMMGFRSYANANARATA